MRSVREAPSAQDAIDDAREKWPRVDEAWEAIFWVLARDPTVGVPLTEFGQLRAFTFEGRFIYEIPTIVVIYEFDQEVITI